MSDSSVEEPEKLQKLIKDEIHKLTLDNMKLRHKIEVLTMQKCQLEARVLYWIDKDLAERDKRP